jgi:hypothetical protein
MFSAYILEKRDFDWRGAKWLSGGPPWGLGGFAPPSYIVKKCPAIYMHTVQLETIRQGLF